ANGANGQQFLLFAQDIQPHVVIGPPDGQGRRVQVTRQVDGVPGGNVGTFGGAVAVDQLTAALPQPLRQPRQVDRFTPQEQVAQAVQGLPLPGFVLQRI